MGSSFSYKQTVPSAWVDYNGHMNDAEYNRAFSLATDAFIDHIGLDEKKREEYEYTIFTLEAHTCYLKELHEGKEFEVEARVLDYDAKRIHLFFTMHNNGGEVVATFEEMLMGIDQNSGRPTPFPGEVAEKVEAEYQANASQDIPKQVGRTIGIRRK